MLLRPIQIGGCQVYWFEPESQWEPNIHLDQVLCLLLPFSDVVSLSLARRKCDAKETLNILERGFVVQLVLQGILEPLLIIDFGIKEVWVTD